VLIKRIWRTTQKDETTTQKANEELISATQKEEEATQKAQNTTQKPLTATQKAILDYLKAHSTKKPFSIQITRTLGFRPKFFIIFAFCNILH
jgi:hypothetical protein